MPGPAPQAELEAVGLGHRLTHYPAQLLAGSSSAWPSPAPPRRARSLIFADEPTGNLDAATGKEIIDLLFARRSETGATLLIITHDPELADRCDRIVTLADGRIASDSAAP